jgi:hypothetical protein
MPVELDSVTVSIAALQAWREACREAASVLSGDIDRESIPDERAELLPGGGLRVFVPHPTRRHRVLAAIVVPADHWTWRS